MGHRFSSRKYELVEDKIRKYELVEDKITYRYRNGYRANVEERVLVPRDVGQVRSGPVGLARRCGGSRPISREAKRDEDGRIRSHIQFPSEFI